jgi:oligopeptide/dipeptide ABC transporter ATP-binding protein
VTASKERPTEGPTSERAPADALLEVRNLHVRFSTPDGVVHAVRGIDYWIAPGEAVGLVGESGSGKSVSALSILRLLQSPPATLSGEIRFRGVDLLTAPPEKLRRIRGSDIAMVFQDPLSSLNPVLTIGQQVSEALAVHRGLHGPAARRRAAELLSLVGISDPDRQLDRYPHQFSGGMRQRVMIAASLSCNPSLLIADEPTTALDVTIQAQILDLLARLRVELGMAIMLITHDLGVVAGVTDRINVMYAGRIVETGPTDVVLSNPRHPYTEGLLRSIPSLDRDRHEPLIPIEGAPPDLRLDVAGCPFQPRCPSAFARCTEARPSLLPAGRGRGSACWLVEAAPA